MSVKTLEIDGQMFTGTEGETVFCARGTTASESPASATSAGFPILGRAAYA